MTEYDVPEDAPEFECRHCGRPFARAEWLHLHKGLDHTGQLDDGEVAAFRDAHDTEEAQLGSFRLQALGALVVIYFCLLMIYALV